MNTINHAQMLHLVEAPGKRFVSLYMPTYPVGRESPQNPVRFKSLLHAAGSQLSDCGMPDREIKSFLAPAAELLDRSTFWDALSRGMAILISAGELHVWHLPLAVEELCLVGKRFHLTPLIAWLHDDMPYYVLSVSQHRVRLLHGTRYTLDELKVPDLPASGIEDLHYDVREGFFQTHSGQPQLRGKESIVFTGQGGEADVAHTEIASLFRLIDSAVSKHLHGRLEPLVFAGVDYLFPIYRQHNHYPHLLTAYVPGNPDLLSPAALREKAWPLVEESLHARRQAAVARYWDVVQQDRASNHVPDIVRAAHLGAIDTLFICPTVRVMGAFDPAAMRVRYDEQPRPDSEDLVNLAACDRFEKSRPRHHHRFRRYSRRRTDGGRVPLHVSTRARSKCRSNGKIKNLRNAIQHIHCERTITMSVNKICIRNVDTASPGETVDVIAQRMHQRAVGTLVVVSSESEPIGIVTDRDLVERVLAKGMSPVETNVRDVMTPGPKTVFEETPIETALALMRSGGFRRLPVVDRNYQLVGLITLDDILMLLAEEFTQVGRLLEKESPRCVVTGA